MVERNPFQPINHSSPGVERLYHKIAGILIFSFFFFSADADNNSVPLSKGFNQYSVPVFSIQTDKDFDDVIEDLLIIIAEQNFRLTQHSRIGKTIAKRNNIAFPPASVLHFCNLDYAQQILEVAPDYLSRMPCRISVMPNTSKHITIQVWLLPENDQRIQAIAQKINKILIDIVTFAAS